MGGERSGENSDAATNTEIPDDSFVVAYRLSTILVTFRRAPGVDGEQESANLTEKECEVDGILIDPNDFGLGLPAMFRKHAAVDDEDRRSCLVFRTHKPEAEVTLESAGDGVLDRLPVRLIDDNLLAAGANGWCSAVELVEGLNAIFHEAAEKGDKHLLKQESGEAGIGAGNVSSFAEGTRDD